MHCRKCGLDSEYSYIRGVNPVLSFRTVVPPKKKKLCLGCRSIIYCSDACQKADWRRHKPACSMINKSKTPPCSIFPTNN